MTAKNTSRFRPTLEILEDRQLLSWASVPPVSVNLNAPNDYHYNISFGTAGGYSQPNTIVPNEVDYRKFVAQRSGYYTFEAQAASGSSIDTVAALYDANGSRLSYNDDFGGTLNSKLPPINLTAGQTYYFGITNYNGSPTGGYWAIITPPSISNNSAHGGDGWFTSGDATLTRSNLHLDLSGSNSTVFSRHTHDIYVQILDLSGHPVFQAIWSRSLQTAGSLIPGTPLSDSRSWDIDLSTFDLGRASSLSVWVD